MILFDCDRLSATHVRSFTFHAATKPRNDFHTPKLARETYLIEPRLRKAIDFSFNFRR